jgi:hypothetical protein
MPDEAVTCQCGEAVARPRRKYCSKKCQNRAAKMTYRSRHPDRVREADKAYTIKYYQGNRKVIQERIRLRKYGLTADELNQMRVDQDFSCAICHIAIAADRGTAARNAEHVDHDHRTGKVRALLCSPCNRTLGVVDDDIDRLRAMIEYLEAHRGSGC